MSPKPIKPFKPNKKYFRVLHHALAGAMPAEPINSPQREAVRKRIIRAATTRPDYYDRKGRRIAKGEPVFSPKWIQTIRKRTLLKRGPKGNTNPSTKERVQLVQRLWNGGRGLTEEAIARFINPDNPPKKQYISSLLRAPGYERYRLTDEELGIKSLPKKKGQRRRTLASMRWDSERRKKASEILKERRQRQLGKHDEANP